MPSNPLTQVTMSTIFSQNNVSSFIDEVATRLEPEYGYREIAIQAAWSLLLNATGKTRAELLAYSELLLSPPQGDQITEWIRAITEEHKPLQYVLGAVFFLDLKITVRPPILIPRPETEDWCDQLIQHLKKTYLKSTEHKPLAILDLCTGSGCIALALAHTFPESNVTAIDISKEACALAKENAHLNKITNIKIIESDLFTQIPTTQRFDLIVSNPPYIAPETFPTLDPSVREWEDVRALVAEDKGLGCIKKIITEAPAFLDMHSVIRELWIEISPEQEKTVIDNMQNVGFTDVTTHQDLTRQARAISGRLK